MVGCITLDSNGNYPAEILIGGVRYVKSERIILGQNTGDQKRIITYTEDTPSIHRMTRADFEAMMQEAIAIDPADYEPFGRLSRDRSFKPDRGIGSSPPARPVGKAQRWIQLSQRSR